MMMLSPLLPYVGTCGILHFGNMLNNHTDFYLLIIAAWLISIGNYDMHQVAWLTVLPFSMMYIQETPMEKAKLFRMLMMERRIIKFWRKYVQIMKTIVSTTLYASIWKKSLSILSLQYRKAEKIAQRKRRGWLSWLLTSVCPSLLVYLVCRHAC